MNMFDTPKRVTQVKQFYTNNLQNRFIEVNKFLRKESVEYVDLKADEEESSLILVYTVPAE